MKKRLRFPIFAYIVLVQVFLFSCCLALAQEPTPQPPPPDTKNQTTPDQFDNSTEAAASIDHPVVVTSTTPFIRQINSAGYLLPSISPLRWGPFYVGYAQFAEILDQGNSFNSQGSFDNTVSQFSAAVVFDKQFRRARVTMQYAPSLTVRNGQVIGNFVNQDTGVSTVFALTSRLTLDLSDHFVYYKSRDSLTDIFLSSDPASGLTLQKDFIESPRSWMSNSATAAFSYAMSTRTRITIAPNYLYATTSGQTTTTTPQTVHAYGVNVSVGHDLTANSSVSGLYTEQTELFPGVSYKTVFQSLQAGYSHSFKGGWNLSGSFGLITANFQSGRTSSESGSAAVVKTFRRSHAAMTYYRGHTFSGYISQQFSDRIDASYQQDIGRHWTLGGGVGYLRDVVTANGIWAKYGEGHVSFGLTRTVSLFGSYVYKWQHGDNIEVFSGNNNYLRCGIQWTQPRAAR
jgi:hypothetical protein